MREFPLMEPGGANILLFHPHIPARAAEAVTEVLAGRWIGQGPRVDEFERAFSAKFGGNNPALALIQA